MNPKISLLLMLLILSCQTGTKEKTSMEVKVQKKEIIENKVSSKKSNPAPTQFSSAIRPDESLLLNTSYTDTITFNDYNDDFDYWYLNGQKNETEVSFIYNWDWRNNKKYNFKSGDLIEINWIMDRIGMAGDEEVIDFVERAIDAKKITSSVQPIPFLKREDRYDESVQATVSTMLINQAYSENISEPEKAALGYIAFDIGNECEWGYDAEGNERVLWCQIVSALNLDYQCSNTQLNFLRNWFSKDSLALKKLQSCPSMPNTATVQTTFNEILIQTDQTAKIITVSYKVSGLNVRESKTWSWSQTDVFEYGAEHIVLVDSEKSDLTKDDIDMNPDAAENIDPQNFVLALKDHILSQWKKQDNFNTLKITFTNNVLNIKDDEGSTLSTYDFNEMVINGTNEPQTLYLTITDEGGGGGGNVMLEETYVLTVLDAENFDIRREETTLID